jgi:hypothetical protein
MQQIRNNTNKSVLSVNSLNIEDIAITNPKLNKDKRLTAGIINTSTNSGAFIQTPSLFNAFGVSSFGESESYSISLKAIGNQNENPDDISKLFNFLKNLDNIAVDYGIKHSLTIFKKKYTEDQRSIMEDLLYNKCVKSSVGSDGTVYPDKITLKIMKKDVDNTPDLLVFKDDGTKNMKEPLEITGWEHLQSLIPKNTPIKAIIQPKIYFVNSKMGINFKVWQILLPNFERVGRPISYAFSDEPSIKNNTEPAIEDSTEPAIEDSTESFLEKIPKQEKAEQLEDAEDSEVEVEEN